MTPVQRWLGMLDAMMSVLEDRASDQPITSADVQEGMRRAQAFLAEHPEEPPPPNPPFDPNLIIDVTRAGPPSFAYPRGKRGR